MERELKASKQATVRQLEEMKKLEGKCTISVNWVVEKMKPSIKLTSHKNRKRNWKSLR